MPKSSRLELSEKISVNNVSLSDAEGNVLTDAEDNATGLSD